MAIDDDKIKQDDSGQSGEASGQGGVGGAIHFRYKDAMSVGPRDDELSPAELKRLLAVHQELHKEYVKKQKQTRKDRQALKEKRVDQRATAGRGLGAGGGAGRSSPYKQHPITSKAQFSGIDSQVIGLPSENQAKTNEDNRNELENRLENRNELRYNNTPKFNPKPRPY